MKLAGTTDTERRSQNSYTAPCNGVVNHGALIRGIWIFVDHKRVIKCRQNASTTFVLCALFHACLSSHSDHSADAPDESQIFWSQEKPEHPQVEPKMEQVLGSPGYICGRYFCASRVYTVTCNSEIMKNCSSHKIYKMLTLVKLACSQQTP